MCSVDAAPDMCWDSAAIHCGSLGSGARGSLERLGWRGDFGRRKGWSIIEESEVVEVVWSTLRGRYIRKKGERG